MIARLPGESQNFMGEHLEIVCLLQAAEIERLIDNLDDYKLRYCPFNLDSRRSRKRISIGTVTRSRSRNWLSVPSTVTDPRRKATSWRNLFKSRHWSCRSTRRGFLRLIPMFRRSITRLWSRSRLCTETTAKWKMTSIRLSVISALGRLSLRLLKEPKIEKLKKWKIPLRLIKNIS